MWWCFECFWHQTNFEHVGNLPADKNNSGCGFWLGTVCVIYIYMCVLSSFYRIITLDTLLLLKLIVCLSENYRKNQWISPIKCVFSDFACIFCSCWWGFLEVHPVSFYLHFHAIYNFCVLEIPIHLLWFLFPFFFLLQFGFEFYRNTIRIVNYTN